MNIQIEKDVPMPDSGRTGSKYPVSQLTEVGDSFFVPGKTLAKSGAGIYQAAKRAGIRVVARTVTENGVGGIRVWRVDGEPRAPRKAAPEGDAAPAEGELKEPEKGEAPPDAGEEPEPEKPKRRSGGGRRRRT